MECCNSACRIFPYFKVDISIEHWSGNKLKLCVGNNKLRRRDCYIVKFRFR